MKLRYALIGCGRVSGSHILAAIKNDLDIVGICDLSVTKMEQTAQKYKEAGLAKHFTDYKKMIVAVKPDLVAIATESGVHAQIALNVIDSGCNVIIEKPIALSIVDADQIIARAETRGVKVCACHQNRFNLSVQKLRQAIESQRFGKLLYATTNIRWSRDKDYYEESAWRGTWAQDGGALMNQCIHNIDLLRWMMGTEIITVMSMTDRLKHHYIEAEDFGIGLISFANGSYGIVEGTTSIFSADLESELNVFGEKGVVKLGGLAANRINMWSFVDGADRFEEIQPIFSEEPSSTYGYGHTRLYTDMCQAILDDRQPYVTALDGKRALELVLAFYKSAATGRSVRLPVSECSTLEFDGRFGSKLNVG